MSQTYDVPESCDPNAGEILQVTVSSEASTEADANPTKAPEFPRSVAIVNKLV